MSILMKRILKIAFLVLFVAFDVVAIQSYLNTTDKGKYTVDTEHFDAVVEYGEEFSIDGITIIDNRLFGHVQTELTEDMIIGVEDTDVPGQKKIIFEHNNKQFSVVYDVKYKVEFVSEGKVIDSQLAYLTDELTLPTPEAPAGYKFSHWDYDFSKGLSDNVQINAVFQKLSYPALETISATYGDTLGDFTLPADEFGRWEFVYPLDTPVGDAGKQSFSVKFVLFEDKGYYEYDTVYFDVAKKELSFEIGDTEFVYDGEAHYPTYKLPEDVNVINLGTQGTNAGEYEYGYVIDDINYCGEVSGTFTVAKATATITVSSAEIVYPAAVPTFTYTVEGFDNIELLGVQIVAPEFASAARIYDISATWSNENVDCTVVNGTLTVHKGEAEIGIPDIGTVTYEDKLGDIEFLGKYVGTWTWENPDLIIDTMDGITAWAIFTHQDENYNPARVEIKVGNVQKKQLSITVDGTDFTYEPGVGHTLVYTLSGSNYSDVYESIAVIGNDPIYTAGAHKITLAISDSRYDGEITVQVNVAKADPKPDFTQVVEIEWSKGLTLKGVAAPAGFAWSESENVMNAALNAGTATYTVTYTPEDTDNYLTVPGTLTVKVNKAPTELAGLKELYSKTYDTFSYDILPLLSAYDTDGTISVEYYKDGVKVDSVVNAGAYTAIITVTEGTNHLAREIEVKVEIIPAKNTEVVTNNQTATYLDSTDKLVLPAGIEGKWEWVESTVGNAGTNTLTAKYVPDALGNYEPRTVEVTVNVGKFTLDLPEYLAVQQYTGAELSTGLESTKEYTVDGTLAATDVDTYYVTFTLVDADNYEWRVDKTAVTLERSWKISLAPNAWDTAPTNIVKEYTGNPVYMVAVPEHGEVTITYYLDGVKVDDPTDVGVYTVIIIATDPNYDTLEEEKTIEITVVSVPVPGAGNFTYNGSVQGIEIDDENLDVLYEIDSEQKATNAGDFVYVVLKLKDEHNYKWEGTSDKTVTISRTIAKATISFADATAITKNEWIFNQTAGTVTKATLDATGVALDIETKLVFSTDNVNFIYNSYDELPSTGGLVNAGKYYVKTVVATSDNWNYVETASVAFEVKKAKLDALTITLSDAGMVGGAYYQNLIEVSEFEVTSGGLVIPATITGWHLSDTGFLGEETMLSFVVAPTGDYATNFDAAEFDIKVPLIAVAKLLTTDAEGNAVEKLFGTIEEALAGVNSGDEVWVLSNQELKANTTNQYVASTNVQIKEDITIPTGVRLVLPYLYNGVDEINKFSSGAAIAVYHNSKSSDTPADEKNPMGRDQFVTDAYCTTRVVVCEGVTITVYGELFIAGQLDGGGGSYHFSGQTAGFHAKLVLKDNALIDVKEGGNMELLGIITDASSKEAPARVEAHGTIAQPFVIFDHKGGSRFTAMYKDMATYKNPLFMQYQLMNLEPVVTVHSTGEIKIYGNLYSDSGHNACVGYLVGGTSKHFIQLDEGSTLEADYISKDKTNVIIRGGAKTNSLSLNVEGQSISSASFVFPIPYTFDITLGTLEGQDSATYYMMQQYKLLTGTNFTIDENVTLNANFLAVYDEFSDPLVGDGYYPRTLAPAKLTVNGTLNAATLGGNVYINTETARVNVKATSSVSATTYEVGEIEKMSILSYVKTRESYTWDLTLYNIDGTKLDTTMYAGIGYYTEGGMWKIPNFFELVVGEGYSVTTSDWLVVDADGNVTDLTGGEERTFTTGESLFLSTDGASVTYTLESDYVIFQNGVSASQSDVGKGGTFTIRSPLAVKKAPTISITDNAKTTQTLTLVDENMDGYCELSVTLNTSGSCLSFVHLSSATAFKVNINNEKDTSGNLVYTNGTVTKCSKHSSKNNSCDFSTTIYAVDGAITVTIAKA